MVEEADRSALSEILDVDYDSLEQFMGPGEEVLLWLLFTSEEISGTNIYFLRFIHLYNTIIAGLNLGEDQNTTDSHPFVDPMKNVVLFDEVSLYYFLGFVLIEDLSSQVLAAHMPSEDRRESAKEFFDNLSQYHKQELLYYLDIIDSGTKGELNQLRDLRNDLAHNTNEQMGLLADENTEEKVERMFRVVNRLQEIISGQDIESLIDELLSE